MQSLLEQHTIQGHLSVIHYSVFYREGETARTLLELQIRLIKSKIAKQFF